MRDHLTKAEIKLQNQQNQFSKQLANTISKTQIQAVQDYLNSAKHKEDLKVAFDKGFNVYSAQVKDASLLMVRGT